MSGQDEDKAKAVALEFDALNDARNDARGLVRTSRTGSLATLSKTSGHPFATLVTVATDLDGSPLLLLSRLSAHTQNLLQDPRASLLLSQVGKGDPLAHPRVTFVGEMQELVDPDMRAYARARFLARHPKAALYADFGDFGFWKLGVLGAHFNGGFARAAELSRSDLVLPEADVADLRHLEVDALAHLNADHAEVLSLYAMLLAGQPDGRWRATGLDPDGLDLAFGDLTARIDFPERVRDGAELRKILSALAKKEGQN